MKKIILSLLVAALSISSIMAQQDVKFNAFGMFFKNYGFGYEYVINDEMSAGVFIDYANGSLYLDMLNDVGDYDYDYNRFSFSPEFRFYTNPDFGADKRFFAVYARYQNVNYDNLEFHDNNTNKTIKYGMNNSLLGIGLSTGQKWVTNSGFYFETYWGFGRFFSSNITFDNSTVEEYYNVNSTAAYVYASSWDFRFQFSVGYRIGGY